MPQELGLKFAKVNPRFRKNALWEYAIKSLEKLYENCEELEINKNQLLINMMYMPDSNLIYHSGIFFEVIYIPPRTKKTDGGKGVEAPVLAIGGRYDNTLYHYLNPL